MDLESISVDAPKELEKVRSIMENKLKNIRGKAQLIALFTVKLCHSEASCLQEVAA